MSKSLPPSLQLPVAPMLLPPNLLPNVTGLSMTGTQFPPSLMTASIPKINVNDPRAAMAANGGGGGGDSSPGNLLNIRDPRRRLDPRLQLQATESSVKISSGNHADGDCILMRNLPPNMGEWDIEEYLKSIGVCPKEITLITDVKLRPTGDGVCEFNTPEQARKAAKLDNVNIGDFNVKIEILSRQEAKRLIDPQGLMNKAPLPPSSTERNGQQQQQQRIGNNENYTSPRYDGPEKMMIDNGLKRFGPGPALNGGPNMFGGVPGGPGPRMMHQAQGGNLPHAGRVILLENVPYKATIEDILDFFGNEYNLTPDHVRRRFNERGQPAGEAKVLFNTPEACNHAFNAFVRQNKSREMLNRRVFMKMQ